MNKDLLATKETIRHIPMIPKLKDKEILRYINAWMTIFEGTDHARGAATEGAVLILNCQIR